jgi:hypothetical protein
MNPNDDKAWEARIDRALKGLPELPAPAGLVERTMAALEHEPKPSWLRQPWPMWPVWLRTVSFISLLSFLGVICAVKWNFAQTFAERLVQRVDAHFASWRVILGALNSLGHAALTVARSLNGWMAILILIIPAAAYFACIGLGTAATRLTFSRR